MIDLENGEVRLRVVGKKNPTFKLEVMGFVVKVPVSDMLERVSSSGRPVRVLQPDIRYVTRFDEGAPHLCGDFFILEYRTETGKFHLDGEILFHVEGPPTKMVSVEFREVELDKVPGLEPFLSAAIKRHMVERKD